ncbi:MAG: aldo/keto reductase [Acidobacteriia bacterium]|nr:aldo/keto reductase [Terriglobia bacterium]
MDYVGLGRTGLKVSRLCLGTMTYGSRSWRKWVLEEEESRPFFRRAVELGINFFDTADMYSLGVSEEIVGRALRDLGPREAHVVATKVFFPSGPGPNDGGLSRKHVLAAIDVSLRRLGMDYVDLYVIHRWDPTCPIEETLEALHDVVRAGKARYLGASSMFAWQLAKAQHAADDGGFTRFVSMQNHYNLVYREEEREMIPLCLDQGLALTPWSPLARGFLSGNRRVAEGAKGGDTIRAGSDDFAHGLYYSPGDFRIVERARALADRRGATPARIALAWLLRKPGVAAPIVGVTRLEQLDDLAAALDLELDDEEMRQLEETYEPHRILGHS